MALQRRRQLFVGDVGAEGAEVGPVREEHAEHRQLRMGNKLIFM